MAEEKKETNWMKFWPLVVGVMTVTGVFFGMRSHMVNDALHVNEDEVVLTKEEFKKLLKFATTVENVFPTIKENENAIIEIKQDQAVHAEQYENLEGEHEGLEDKLSREVRDLNDKINKIHE